MPFYCYIIFSKSFDHFYIGYTSDFPKRLKMHNEGEFAGKSYTCKANDWELYMIFECKTIEKAVALEKFIKKKKSRKYLENLKRYPELQKKIINDFS